MAAADEGVSVVATVRDEARTIDALLDSLARQTRPADEVVIVDGGSSDGTLEELRRRALGGDLPLVVISLPGSNISAGRNAAVAAARGPVIAVTDAGVVLEARWLEALLERKDAAGARAVGGFFVADGRGAFETALGATTLPDVDDVEPAAFLPSSRSVAYLKSDWAAAGGYPEWLDYCEDLVFDFRLREVAGPLAFAPDAVARFRPRGDLGSFARQYYRYARGDGKADLWWRRHAIRYGTYLVLGPVLLAAGLAGTLWAWPALGLGLCAVVARPYRRLAGQWSGLTVPERLRALMWVPVIRVTGDLAKMAGYPVGLVWRWRHRPPDWRPAPEVGRS
jgi:glycosyltransferase involved in cell wall biosynthesis